MRVETSQLDPAVAARLTRNADGLVCADRKSVV